MSRNLIKFHTRLGAMILTLTLLLCMIPAASADEVSGTCGDNLNWSLDAGTLTITGSGAMDDYSLQKRAPWHGLEKQILRLELPQGITRIGSYAFYECAALAAAVLPDSVTAVGDYAFAYCKKLTLLNLGSGLQRIGTAAFSDCYALPEVRFPASVRSLGSESFFRCESLTVVTIPETVTDIGMFSFAYCKSLIRATVEARLTELPEWLFYQCINLTSVILPPKLQSIGTDSFMGCDSLNTVYYDGEANSRTEIENLLGEKSGVNNSVKITSDKPSVSSLGSSGKNNGDGTYTQSNTTVVDSDKATVSTTVQHTRPEDDLYGGSYTTDVTVTVQEQQGWSDAADAVADTLRDANDTYSGMADQKKGQVTVYVKNTDEIDHDFISAMAGRNLVLTVNTENGSVWRIDCATLQSETLSGSYNLSYTVLPADASLLPELGALEAYAVQFLSAAQVNAELMIRLPVSCARRNATLIEKLDGEYIRHQTGVVDGEGKAHFYLASVTDKGEYYIAMDLAEEKQNAIIPDELLPEYGYPEPIRTLDYVTTGIKSDWGMDIGQVTWIMIGVMVAVVIGVGVTMYALNKRKLRMGYIPDIDEEDYE